VQVDRRPTTDYITSQPIYDWEVEGRGDRSVAVGLIASTSSK
jgi:hypothetical protein